MSYFEGKEACLQYSENKNIVRSMKLIYDNIFTYTAQYLSLHLIFITYIKYKIKFSL